jgi:hypothetical protein
MGRFAWTQGHTKQPSDRQHGLPEWFSKASGEPSRQALTEIIKEQGPNSPPRNVSTRSRTNTLSSVPSRATGASDSSQDTSSRPSSRQSMMQDAQTSPNRPDRSSKHILSKGSRIMRRQTSRFNMLTHHSESSDATSRKEGLSRVRSAGHILSLHSSKKSESRPQISGPFDFQHIAHTNPAQFQHLSKASQSAIEETFTAIQATQQPEREVRGMPVTDVSTPSPTSQSVEPPLQSPTFSIVPSLPATPPQPPPKDLHLKSPVSDIRISRSVENFSWPNKSPLLDLNLEFPSTIQDAPENATGVGQPSCTSVSASNTPEVLGAPFQFESDLSGKTSLPADPLDKPLPQPPTMVHAVSTADESTLPMKTTPLPAVPPPSSETSIQPFPEHVVSLPRNSVRLTRSFPAGGAARRRSQSSSEIPFADSFVSAGAILSSPREPIKDENRISVGIKKIDIDDWEDAIDYSWDHALDEDHPSDPAMRGMAKSDVLPQSTFNSSSGPHRVSSAMQLSGLSAQPTHPMRHYRSEMSLSGLGINPARSTASGVSSVQYDDYSDKHDSLQVPYKRRDHGSLISKSSSQESIILSIASSIMSTHRSSNSSTSLGDFGQLESIEDESVLSQYDRKPIASGSDSVSSTETVTTDQQSTRGSGHFDDPRNSRPGHHHERGTSTTRLPPVPNRTSSAAPAAKSATRQRSSTLNSQRRLNTRISYSLFPSAQAPPPAI